MLRYESIQECKRTASRAHSLQRTGQTVVIRKKSRAGRLQASSGEGASWNLAACFESSPSTRKKFDSTAAELIDKETSLEEFLASESYEKLEYQVADFRSNSEDSILTIPDDELAHKAT